MSAIEIPQVCRNVDIPNSKDPEGQQAVWRQKPLATFSMVYQNDELVKTSCIYAERLIDAVRYVTQMYKVKIRRNLTKPG